MLKGLKRRLFSIIMAIAVVVNTTAVGGITAFAATPIGTNILVNPNAVENSGWIFCDGDWQYSTYSSPNVQILQQYLGSSDDRLFDCYNNPTGIARMEQTFSLDGLDSKINKGYITAEFSIGHYLYDQLEICTLIMEFLNSSGTLIGSESTTYDGDGKAINQWHTRQISGQLPADTVSIKVKVMAGPDSLDYGIVLDGASLELTDNTPANAPATVTTQAATSATATTATFNGNLTGLGIPAATEYGFCYSTSASPTTADTKVSKGAPSATGAYTADITGLSPATTYYVRAYAINDTDTAYGAEISLTTLALTAPTITADTTANDVDHDIELTFISDAAYEAAITKVMYGSTELTKDSDYAISSGKITLKLTSASCNSSLRVPSSLNVTISATGYTDAVVNQTTTAGTATTITVNASPTVGSASGEAFATQPSVTLYDQYNNVCLNGPSASASVTATAKAGIGTWEIGATTTVNAAGGAITFSGLTCTSLTMGTGAITFTSGSLTTDSEEFTLPKFGGLAVVNTPAISVPSMLETNLAYSVDLDSIISINKTDLSNKMYTASITGNAGDIINSGDSVTATGSTLDFTLNQNIASAATASNILITISSDNYNSVEVTIPVNNSITLTAPTLSGTISAPSITYGDNLSASPLTGTFVDGGDSSTVAGALSWDAPTTKPNAGNYTANWTFIPTNRLKYSTLTGTANVTVAKRPITIALENSSYSKTYRDSDPVFNYNITSGSLVSGETLTEPVLQYTGANVGTYDIVVDPTKSTNYDITLTNGTGAMVINKRPLAISSLTIADKTYDGTAIIDPASITVTFNNTAGETIIYTCSATPYVNANVGTEKPTSVTVTLTDASNTNYSLNTSTSAVSGAILKATLTSASFSSAASIVENIAAAYTYDLDSIVLAGITGLQTTGARTYSLASTTGAMAFTSSPNISGSTLSFTTDASNTDGTTQTISIVMGSENYNDITAVLTINTVSRTTVTISGVSVANKAYDGTQVAPSGTPVFNDGSANVTITAPEYQYTSTDGAGYSSTQAPQNAGAYKLTISVPSSNTDYIGSTEIPFSITKASLTITADNKTIAVGDAMPAYTLSYSGFKNSESESTAGLFTTAPAASCAGNSDTATTYNITLNTPVSPNYAITTVNGTLTVNSKASDASFYTVSPSPNASGWYNSDIRITPTGKEGFNFVGVDGIFYSAVTFMGESADQSYSLCFKKGNAITELTTFTYKMDKTAPVLSNTTYDPAVSLVHGLYNFFTSSISVSVDVSDNLSGVDSVSYELIPDANGGVAKTGTASVSGGKAVVSIDKGFVGAIRFTASDLAGNAAASITSNFATEDTAPTIAFSNALPNSQGWHNSDVTVDINVKDNANSAISGGLKTISYSSVEGTTDYTPAGIEYEYTKQIVVATEGGYTYTVTATDNAGNQSTNAVTIKLDKTAPNISAVTTNPINVSRLYNGYQLTISATDAGGSGIAGYSIDGGASWQTSNVFDILTSTNISAANIKVKDNADIITAYTGSNVTVTIPKITSYFALSSNKASIKYGESLTIIADVTTDSGITNTLDGTVTFYLGTDATGTKIAENVAIVNGKATCELTKVIYTTAGNKNFYAVYSGNGNFEPSSASLNSYIVEKLPLTIKAKDITCYSGNALPTPTIKYTGFIDGENETNAFTSNAIAIGHTAINTNTAGAYPITLSGDAVTPNYTITKQNGILTVKVKASNAVESTPTATPQAGTPGVIIPTGSVPDNANLSDIRLVVDEPTAQEQVLMSQVAQQRMDDVPTSQILQYNISLIDLADGNATVQPKGFITIVLPYPAGTNKSFTFSIIHLKGGTTPEIIPCTNTDNGVQFSVDSLSPFILGYVQNNTGTSSRNKSSRNNTTQDFWDEVEAEIKSSKSVDVIRAEAASYLEIIPIEVIEAIKGKNAVLNISWQGEEIIINGNDVKPIESNRIFYTLKALSALYKNSKADISVGAQRTNKPAPVNPDTGGIANPTVIIHSIRDIAHVQGELNNSINNANITSDGIDITKTPYNINTFAIAFMLIAISCATIIVKLKKAKK